ncbi:hypothetical protein [Herbiconiux sp. A18JL235]|uniref:Modulator of FtsH protease n=1 Tax=Herbiconiux sp. A18JL235 TaxID=3152363 RepID=A0AB39BCR9_9MICO
MEAVIPEGWTDFAVASAGAAGALAGLIMVVISVNVKEIIQGESLPSRAVATIASVVVILVGSVAMLIPGQPLLVLGVEMVVFAAIAVALQIDAVRRMYASHGSSGAWGRLAQVLLGVGSPLWVAAGGVALVASAPWGLYLVAVGFISIFMAAVLNAWVLMIEILR